MTSLYLSAGLGLGMGGGVAFSPFLLQKKRVDYPEMLVYDPMPGSTTEWRRWLATPRYNTGNIGGPRIIRNSVAKLYASAATAPIAENLTTGTQAQAPTATQGTSGGSRIGTYVGPATVNGVTDIIYSVTTADKTTYTVTSARRIVWRTLCNSANGGIAAITVKASGVEVDAAYYTIPLASGERRVDLRLPTTGLAYITLADDLPLGAYTVEIVVSSANPGGGRVYDGGMQTFALTAYNSTGRLGTWENRTVGSTANVPTAFYAGAVAIYAFTGTRVAWRRGVSTNTGKVDLRVYDSGGTEISAGKYLVTSNELDNYNGAGTQVVTTAIAEGLTYGTYYLKIEVKPDKNASSSAYRCYDYGIVAYDETTPGVLGVDAFDDQGITEAVSYEGQKTIVGTGNLELAIKLYKSTSDIGTATFAGGTHGFETTPSDMVVYVDGQVVDFAGAADEAVWTGRRSLRLTYSTTLKFPEDSSQFATVAYDVQFVGGWYYMSATITFTVATAKVIEMYVMMLNVPNTDTGTQGIDGGFALFGDEIDDPDAQSFTAFNDSSHGQPAQMSRFVFFNDGYAAIAEQLNQAEINATFSDVAYAGSRDLTFVQDRSDKFVKAYNRAFSGSDTGVVMPNGLSFTYRSRYYVRKLA